MRSRTAQTTTLIGLLVVTAPLAGRAFVAPKPAVGVYPASSPRPQSLQFGEETSVTAVHGPFGSYGASAASARHTHATGRGRTRLRAISYESLMEKLPSQAVVDAVASAKGDKVIASDIATRAGVSLSQARKDLTALASLSRGDISVSDSGELIYEFPPNLNGVLTSNSAKYKAQQTLKKIWPTAFWLIRIGFGAALVTSIFLITTTIFFLLTASSSDDRDDRRGDSRGGGGGMSFGGMNIWGPSPFDFFYYRPYGYYGYYAEGPDRRDPDQMGFLESVFSYVFGDGNPNQGLEEKRLSLAAQMIRDNNGAVTAEQLAPYLDAPAPEDRASGYIDESFVLPIVAQLDGEPQVTEDGDIVYVFPDLQVSASSTKVLSSATEESMILKRAGLSANAPNKEIKELLYYNGIDTRGALERKELVKILKKALPPMTREEKFELEQEASYDDPSLLQEREYKFSLAPDGYRFFSGALGVFNLGGALYLGNLLNQYALYGVKLPSYYGFVQSAYPLLLVYAVLFNAIPLVRNFWIGQQNRLIEQRNTNRRKWRERLMSRAGDIRRKLEAATRFGRRQKQLKADDIVYDTKQGASELKVKRDQSDLDEFDKLLRGDGADGGSFQ